jgi:hypothetical protein
VIDFNTQIFEAADCVGDAWADMALKKSQYIRMSWSRRMCEACELNLMSMVMLASVPATRLEARAHVELVRETTSFSFSVKRPQVPVFFWGP